MSFKYIITKRIFGYDETNTEKYVVTPVSSGKIAFKTLCDKVTSRCGAHRGMTKLVIDGLIDVMSEEIDDGKTIQLGEFGTFRPSFRTHAADCEENAKAGNIYRRKIVFTPGEIFKDTLRKMSVTRHAIPELDYTNGKSTDNNDNDDDGNPTI